MRSTAALQHINGRSADASAHLGSFSSSPPLPASSSSSSVLSMSSADRRLPCTLRTVLSCVSGCRRWLVLPRKARWLLGGSILVCGLWVFVALLPQSDWTTQLPRPQWTTPAATADSSNSPIAAQHEPAPAPSPPSVSSPSPPLPPLPSPPPSPPATPPPPADSSAGRAAALSSLLSAYVPRHYSDLRLAEARRLLVFSVGDDGLGNKLLPLVSSLLLSLLLNRTFLLALDRFRGRAQHAHARGAAF